MEIKTLGILGGGQLGRMSALAAANLGIRANIFCPEKNCPASQVTDLFTCAEYEDESALKAFADSVDVITYEFENIPIETVRYLQGFKPVYPDEKLLEVSQNRLKEKKFLNDIGIRTAPWVPAYKSTDIDEAIRNFKSPKCILKTARFGYDGKGQIKHDDKSSSQESWSKLNTNEAILEGIIDFDFECSIIVARDTFGKSEVFPVTFNEHSNHILSKSIVPHISISDTISTEAHAVAVSIADAVGLVGVLALELFVTKQGDLLANEIAPRTHNSGHWTMDACTVSQFDQHVRAVCGLPVLKPVRHSDVTMINIIGDDVKRLSEFLSMDNARVHLYGKTEARDGRKMGHVNLLTPLTNPEK